MTFLQCNQKVLKGGKEIFQGEKCVPRNKIYSTEILQEDGNFDFLVGEKFS